MIENHYKLVLETALLCSTEPLSLNELGRLYGDEVTPENIIVWIHQLQNDWSEKGLELVQAGTGWRFQSRLSMREYLDRLNFEKPPKYSRAVMETLAIIAYRQPVTRGEIEEIRGVAVSSQIIRQLEDRNWIEVIGHKDTVGRPGLFATTKQFLDDMAISGLKYLPALDDGTPVADIAQQVINFEELATGDNSETENTPVDFQEVINPESLESTAPVNEITSSDISIEEENLSSITEIKNNE
ncbi:SMC-Scp complex subunit ScpB [Polynucleobacter rarus]|uniref:SMC-Scp complex subunit ScpB n=1 Tax=Polynucleobacter rarus TaxID=556055 RepID=UPI000D3E8BB8|nr:SMC-Scp complex subunit ScpB [Polynucleobacter rarus]